MIWTFLVITYGAGPLDGYQSVVAMPSQQACEEQMLSTMEALMPIMPDIMLQCIDSGVMSHSLRPKRRPW